MVNEGTVYNEVEDQYQRPKHIISISDWLIIFLIQIIPVVNIICLFYWALSKSTPVSKSNWAKASIIATSIVFVLYFIIFAASISSL